MKAYRLITDKDTSEFCHRVTKALNEGWELYGSPSYAYDATQSSMRCAQAVVKDAEGEYSADINLGDL